MVKIELIQFSEGKLIPQFPECPYATLLKDCWLGNPVPIVVCTNGRFCEGRQKERDDDCPLGSVF